MSQHDDRTSLLHMVEHAREAIDFCRGKRVEDLAADRILSLAVTRLIEIIGEAAARVTDETRSAHPEIPWRTIIGTRNRIVHAYDQIDFEVLSDTVADELPAMVALLERILETLQ